MATRCFGLDPKDVSRQAGYARALMPSSAQLGSSSGQLKRPAKYCRVDVINVDIAFGVARLRHQSLGGVKHMQGLIKSYLLDHNIDGQSGGLLAGSILLPGLGEGVRKLDATQRLTCGISPSTLDFIVILTSKDQSG
jgi:hypothetical protein